MRVAVDATPLLGSRTGVATFTTGLLRALPAAGVDVRAYALSGRGRRALAAALPPGVVPADARLPMPAGVLTRAWQRADVPVAEQFVGRVDVVHGTNYVVPPARHAAEVVTVYDLTSARFPELCAPASLRYPQLVRRAAARGAWVHVLAQAIGDEVVELLGVDPDRVRVIRSGLDAPVSGGDAARGARLAGSPRYVLGLGTVEPRKRFDDLVRAFDGLAADRDDIGLVIAGPDGWGAPDVASAIDRALHRRRIRRIGWVDERDRADLLAGATALAVPSVYEGFGYPPLEAMAAGTPVVATSVGALPEVLGNGAEFVPATDVDALVGALGRVLDDATHRARLVERGRARAATFSWDECATEMARLYEDAMAARTK